MDINSQYFQLKKLDNYPHNIFYSKIDNIWYFNGNKVYTTKSDAEAIIKTVKDQEKLNIQNFKNNFIDKNVTVWTIKNTVN